MLLHIFIIHSEGLTQRATRLHGVVQNMRVAAQYLGFDVRPYFVLTPTAEDVGNNQAQYSPKISYDPTGIPELDNTIKVVSVEILSNFQKHINAWKMIGDAVAVGNDNDYYMVLEDDTFMLPDSFPAYVELLKLVQISKDWDVIIMGIAHKSAGSDTSPLTLHDTSKLFKMLPTKDAYMITKETATRLYADFSDTDTSKIKFPMRGQLSWYIQTHPDLRVRNPSKQVTIDGSKLGLTPTSLHESNILIFNAEYMQLLEYMNKNNEVIKADIEQIKVIFQAVDSLESSDVLHLYGILLFRAGLLEESYGIMSKALKMLKDKQGLVNSRTELVNNFIDMCKSMQTDIKETDILSTPSKYLNVV